MSIDLTEPPAPSNLDATGGRASSAARKIDELDLHSEDVQEVLGIPPRWLVRWGSTVVLAVVALLLGLTWLLRYPDDATVMPYIGRSGWNNLRVSGAIGDDEIMEAIDASYAAIVSKLPKKDRPA